MKCFSISLLLGLMLFLTSCGGGGPTPVDPASPLPHQGPIEDANSSQEVKPEAKKETYVIWKDLEKTETPDDNKNYLKILDEIGDIKFYCPEEGCHPSVGLVYSLTGRCEGTLISEDEILTANHCIQDIDINNKSISKYLYLNNIPKSCENIAVYLPETKDYSEEKLGCKSVRGSNNWDFAIIRLNRKVLRKTMKLESGTSVTSKTAIVINRIDKGQYKEEFVPCEQAHASYPLNIHRAKRALKKCNIIRGNSGGPILNENGNLWGVVSGFEQYWNVEIASSSECINAFLKSPEDSLSLCWNQPQDVTEYMKKHVKNIPQRDEGYAFITEDRTFDIVGTIPKCISELNVNVRSSFKSAICRLQRKKINSTGAVDATAFDCRNGTVTFTIRIDFGSHYLTRVRLDGESALHIITESYFIPKCKDK